MGDKKPLTDKELIKKYENGNVDIEKALQKIAKPKTDLINKVKTDKKEKKPE